MKLGMISLGCSKNLIDSELFLGVAKKYNLEITPKITEADILVVNTCGFIESAKKEAIDTILELTEYQPKNKKIIVMGCLVERYFDELKEAIPEVDFYFPIRDYQNIDILFQKILDTSLSYKFDYQSRLLTTLPHSAYLRIGEGCNNRCAFCAIPLIRGNFHSREPLSILNEAKMLVDSGVKEITLIAQDTTRYGTDLSNNYFIHDLLTDLCKIEHLELVRILYLYPDEITDQLIDTIANNPKIAKYFDIPIQHASDKMLELMHRRGNKAFLSKLINKIRHKIPDVIIRTTLIVGFPNESEKDFQELVTFIKHIRFERLGAFKYSDEEDTPAFNMKNKISDQIMENRYNTIMKIQEEIINDINASLVGQEYQCIIDKYDSKNNRYVGRSYAFAPDDVDGYIYITSKEKLKIGHIYKVKITGYTSYDLTAKKVS